MDACVRAYVRACGWMGGWLDVRIGPLSIDGSESTGDVCVFMGARICTHAALESIHPVLLHPPSSLGWVLRHSWPGLAWPAQVMERTFRPPYYHRNVMAEFMGMVYGK